MTSVPFTPMLTMPTTDVTAASTVPTTAAALATEPPADLAPNIVAEFPIEHPAAVELLAESLPESFPESLPEPPEDAARPHSLLPPPEQTFATRNECLDFVREWGLSQGYAPTIRHSSGRSICMHCDKSGSYSDRINAPEGAKRRRTTTRRQNCPFLVYAGYRKKIGKWILKVKNGAHNHEADIDMIAHPTSRRLTPQQVEIIRSATLLNHKPVEIMGMLRGATPNHPITMRDIYNARAEMKRKARESIGILRSNAVQ